jgi:hypothetical protein
MVVEMNAVSAISRMKSNLKICRIRVTIILAVCINSYLWNALRPNLNLNEDVNAFKKALKKDLCQISETVYISRLLS